MKDLRIRCSSLAKIMGSGKGMFGLTDTATSLVKELVKAEIYQYDIEINSKYLDKGNDCEDAAIELFNEHNFTQHEKNTVRMHNEWLSGECDINAPGKIIDIKCPWSKETFPATKEEAEKGCKKAGYEWQLRGYMWLYNKDEAELAYCLMDTPDYLIEYEQNKSIHEIGQLDDSLRITSIKFKRDTAKEEKIKEKVGAARQYAEWYLKQIKNK